jgi:hypothetical protein
VKIASMWRYLNASLTGGGESQGREQDVYW